MIKSFKHQTEGVSFWERQSLLRWKHIEKQCRKRLEILDAASDLMVLASLPSNQLEKLKGQRTGQYSIRINDQYRVCFQWKDNNAYEVEIVDYHDEKK